MVLAPALLPLHQHAGILVHVLFRERGAMVGLSMFYVPGTSATAVAFIFFGRPHCSNLPLCSLVFGTGNNCTGRRTGQRI